MRKPWYRNRECTRKLANNTLIYEGVVPIIDMYYMRGEIQEENIEPGLVIYRFFLKGTPSLKKLIGVVVLFKKDRFPGADIRA